MKIPVINELFREGLQVQIKMLLSSACNSIAYEILTVTALLISIGKLKHTIGMITYRNISALDSKGKTAFKSFYL